MSSQSVPQTNPVHRHSQTILNPSLLKLKILDYLRNNDSQKLTTLIKEIDEANDSNLDKLKHELLLYAVQVGPLSIIQYIVQHKLMDDLNSQDSDGNTALHLAAISHRDNVIEYLLQTPDINDCILNNDLKQPIECSSNMETVQIMNDLRTKYVEVIANELRKGFESRNFELLEKLLTNPRAKELLDINGTDPITGDTVLLEFIKKDDLEMVAFILKHGGDPFKRSLSGILPTECTTNPEMKKLIEDSCNDQSIMDSGGQPQVGCPTFKGFLKKWTNFAGGYKLRWFVLDSQARLSYYKSPNDINNSCRGMIHLAHAMLKMDSSETSKFEIIIQNPSDGSPVKWHLKANHVIETNRWVWILQNAITFAKDLEKRQKRISPQIHILQEDLVHHPATIPETGVLPNSSIENENGHRKPISSIVSDATSAAQDFKEIVDASASDTDLTMNVGKFANVSNYDHNQTLEISHNGDNDNNSNNNASNNENENDDNHSNSNTNISDENFNSLRNQVGPGPNRNPTSSNKNHARLASFSDGNDSLNRHGRVSSVASFTSSASGASEVESRHSVSTSKSSRAKKLYKKPMKTLSSLGRKTRDSFIVGKDSEHQKQKSPVLQNSSATFPISNRSQSSFAESNISSAASSPDMKQSSTVNIDEEIAEGYNNGNNDEEDDDDDEEGQTEEGRIEEGQAQEEEEVSEAVKKHRTPNNSDLVVLRNQMTVLLKAFREFLNTAFVDEKLTKHDVVKVASDSLSTLEILINKEGELMNHKDTRLETIFDRQREISSIWERSIKQLEYEIRDRETKIVELEDKLRNVKKSLRNSVGLMYPQQYQPHQQQNQQQQQHQQQIVPDLTSIPSGSSAPFVDSYNANSAASLARQALAGKLSPSKPQPRSAPPAVPSNYPVSAPPVPFSAPASVPSPSSQETSSRVPPNVPIADPTLAKFLEEDDDSDEEFFDAADEVKDMSVLERRETMKARRKSAHLPSAQSSTTDFEQNSVGPIPSVTGSKMTFDDSIVPSESTAVGEYEPNEPNKQEVEATEEPKTGEPEADELETEQINKVISFKPKVDKRGRYVVNKHELECEIQTQRYEKILKDHTFKGYEDPMRTSLAPEDTRPKMSLWGVLKSLVGKDMTKMTLPVTFNEPTSLLQRNTEVLEYSDLLDKAAAIDSSTLRLVYVATFAASEYASTVGRIAKPFNPLLGETFEYARPDKGYRCFVEQVSHHPPISSLIAEASTWSYYGESNVKTKFLGRSFDIKHLGTWFCELYPDAGVVNKNGKKSDMELYSWKKVNNSVIGIIVGNPQIDNYGEMEIRNHMTGDYMKFNFKQRGWRASSAYEVKGEVFSSDGKLRYHVGGHWDSTIFCKPANDKNAERFLVWEAEPRKEMMFHLTSYAASLNAPLPHLLPVVACTDTRLRPDQRAMENGDYDFAAEEKNRVEEKQREAKRQRDFKGETYNPSFFVKGVHPVTGEDYWKYNGTYWSERNQGKLKNYKDIF